MQLSLLDKISDPASGSKLSLFVFEEVNYGGMKDIQTGILIPSARKYYYPITEGIPRLLIGYKDIKFENKYKKEIRYRINVSQNLKMLSSEEENIKTFSIHWKNLHSFQVEGVSSFGVGQEQMASDLKRIFKLSQKKLSEKWILDAGCGNANASIAFLKTGANVVAMDITEAVDQCARYCRRGRIDKRNRLHFIQASVEHPPFFNETFDIIYCHGVLHHTLSTKNAFKKLARLVKRKGSFYLWVYAKENLKRMRAINWANMAIRFLLRHLGNQVIYYFSFIWVYTIRLYYTVLFWLGIGDESVMKLSPREHLLGTYDRFSTRFEWKHTYQEVGDWFSRSGFDYKKVRGINSPPDYENYGVSILGVKR